MAQAVAQYPKGYGCIRDELDDCNTGDTNAASLEVENYKIIWNNTKEIITSGDGEGEQEPERKSYHQDGKEPENIGAKTSRDGLKAFGCAGVAGMTADQVAAAIITLDAIGLSICTSGSSALMTGALGASSTISATGLGYAGLAAVTGGFGLLGLAAIGGIGHYAYKAYKGYNDPARKEFNRLAEEYKKKVLEYKEKKQSLEEMAKKIQECFLKLKEDELLRYALAIKELSDGNDKRRIIIVIGPTGCGKSLVCNRLFGDDAKIKVIRRDENRLFKVGKLGQGKSETSSMKMISSDIKMAAEGTEKKEFKLYVTDTPGATDSQGKDDLYDKQMTKFCDIIGGVNAFLLFFKFNNKVDNNYKTLLKKYNKLWGDMFWQYCIIVVTHCDRDMTEGWDDDDEKEFQDRIKSTEWAITDALNEVSGNRFGETCKERIITFGKQKKEWKPSVLKLFLNLYDDYKIVYKPQKEQSPLHKLLYQQKEEAKNLKRVVEELKDLKEKMSEQEKIMQN